MRLTLFLVAVALSLAIGFGNGIENRSNRWAVAAGAYACGYADAMSKAAYGRLTDTEYCEPYRAAARDVGNFP